MNRVKQKSIINSLCWVIMLALNPLTWLLSFGVDNFIVIISIFCLMLYFIAGNNPIQKKVLPLTILCLTFFLLTLFAFPQNITVYKYFYEFLAMGCVAFYVSQVEFDFRRVILYLSLVSIIVIPVTRDLVVNATDTGQLMGLSYGCLRLILALILALFIFPVKNKTLWIILLCTLGWYINFFAPFATRGGVLALCIFSLLIFFAKKIKLSKWIFLFLSIIVIFLSISFVPIIKYMSDILAQNNISFGALEKIIILSENDNISNGRFEILQRGFKMGLESPIWGNGIAAYEFRYCEGWVHNIFVQIFLEGGLFLLIPFILIVIRSFILIFGDRIHIQQKTFLIFLLCGSLIELQFSNYLWRSQAFWLYIGYTIKLWKNSKITKEKIQRLFQKLQ